MLLFHRQYQTLVSEQPPQDWQWQNMKEGGEGTHSPHSEAFPPRTAETWDESVWQETAFVQ